MSPNDIKEIVSVVVGGTVVIVFILAYFTNAFNGRK